MKREKCSSFFDCQNFPIITRNETKRWIKLMINQLSFFFFSFYFPDKVLSDVVSSDKAEQVRELIGSNFFSSPLVEGAKQKSRGRPGKLNWASCSWPNDGSSSFFRSICFSVIRTNKRKVLALKSDMKSFFAHDVIQRHKSIRLKRGLNKRRKRSEQER